MIINNGEKWVAPKYKITQPLVIYDDNIDGYDGATIEENILSEEQKARLMEIEFIQMSEDEARKYVMNGDGEIPDRRSDIDKLIEMMAVEDMTDEIINFVPTWVDGLRIEKGSYVTYNNIMYKSLQTHTANRDYPPDTTNYRYVIKRKGTHGDGEEPDLWVQPTGYENVYNKGDRVKYFDGLIYVSKIDGNAEEPTKDEPYNRYWELEQN